MPGLAAPVVSESRNLIRASDSSGVEEQPRSLRQVVRVVLLVMHEQHAYVSPRERCVKICNSLDALSCLGAPYRHIGVVMLTFRTSAR